MWSHTTSTRVYAIIMVACVRISRNKWLNMRLLVFKRLPQERFSSPRPALPWRTEGGFLRTRDLRLEHSVVYVVTVLTCYDRNRVAWLQHTMLIVVRPERNLVIGFPFVTLRLLSEVFAVWCRRKWIINTLCIATNESHVRPLSGSLQCPQKGSCVRIILDRHW